MGIEKQKDQPESKYPYSIHKDGDGRYRRIWVDQRVTDDASILSIQEKLCDQVQGFVPARREGLHMTLAHFGVPEELYEEFRLANPTIPFDTFMASFYGLLEASSDIVTSPTTHGIENLALLNRDKTSVVLLMGATQQLNHARVPLLNGLTDFVASLSVADPARFIGGSRNLWVNQTYVPHVTIGRVPKGTQLPQLSVSDQSLSFRPSRIAHVKRA